MKTPLFITSSSRMLPNWQEAFPGASHFIGCPEKFDQFDRAIIFLDYMNLSGDKRSVWLTKSLETGRQVIVLSPTPSESEAISAIKSGVVGYGHTLAAAARLREMAMVVNHGGLWLGSTLLKRVLDALGQSALSDAQAIKNGAQTIKNREQITPNKRTVSPAAVLSERESAVAQLVARGATNQEIATSLAITERTVKAHVTSSFAKLKVRNRVELALLLNNIAVSDVPTNPAAK